MDREKKRVKGMPVHFDREIKTKIIVDEERESGYIGRKEEIVRWK